MNQLQCAVCKSALIITYEDYIQVDDKTSDKVKELIHQLKYSHHEHCPFSNGNAPKDYIYQPSKWNDCWLTILVNNLASYEAMTGVPSIDPNNLNSLLSKERLIEVSHLTSLEAGTIDVIILVDIHPAVNLWVEISAKFSIIRVYILCK